MTTAEQEIRHLAVNRLNVMNIASAAGMFLATPGGVDDMPEVKTHAERTLDAAFDEIDKINKRIKQLKEHMK